MTMDVSTQLQCGEPTTILVFSQSGVSASQTGVQLTTAGAVEGITLPWPGIITAISADLSAAAGAGQLDIAPTIGGTAQAAPVLQLTTATTDHAQTYRGAAPFSAGDVLGVEITTDASWDATTADLTVTLWATLDRKDD